ncbi:MAG TPA: hypothetical protein VG674_16060 [Amycolatopsis sp.]|nr:hypothetical protein [Amycolatopsis sp.]
MHAWWPLATGAALFVVLAVLFLRRSARSQAVREGLAPPKTRARHRVDDADPLARYPVARQRPVPMAAALPQPRATLPQPGAARPGKIISGPTSPGTRPSRTHPAAPDPSGRGRKRRGRG